MKYTIVILIIVLAISTTYAQVGINTDGSAPHSSALLDVKSTTKAFYPPRMTTAQKNAIVNKQIGATVYDFNENALSYYNGSFWVNSFPLPLNQSVALTGDLFKISNTGAGSAIVGATSSHFNGYGIHGISRDTTPINNGNAGVYGESLSKTTWGSGVIGTHAGFGSAIKGFTTNGTAGDFRSTNGYALTCSGKLLLAGINASSGRFLKSISSFGDAQWADLFPIDYTGSPINDIIEISNTNTGNGSALHAHTYSTGTGAAISGEAEAATGGIGVYGYNGGTGRAIFGYTNNGIGISGYSASGGIGGLFSSVAGYALITENGNVGIGTNTPVAKMDIKGSDYFTHFYYGANEDTYIRGGKAGSRVLINDEAGQGSVGIGITSPNQYLDIKGRMRIYHSTFGTAGLWLNNASNTFGGSDGAFVGINCSAAGSETVGFFIGGQWGFDVDRTGNGRFGGTVTTTSGFACASDLRYKKDIQPLENALENIQRINGVSYHWKNEEFPDRNFPNQNQIGFIAQDLEKIYPEMVFTDAKGYKSVDYARLTPVLVEALKELKNENTNLKENQKSLESRLEKLEEILTAYAKK